MDIAATFRQAVRDPGVPHSVRGHGAIVQHAAPVRVHPPVRRSGAVRSVGEVLRAHGRGRRARGPEIQRHPEGSAAADETWRLVQVGGTPQRVLPRALSVRWTRKWVVCDHRQLSYYSSSAEPPAKQKPRKTIPLKDCAVRFYQDMLLIEFNHWPAAGMGKNGGSGGGGGGGFGEDEEDDDDDEEDRLYTLTFRCVDVKEFGDWSRFIRGAKYHTPRQKIPSHPVLRSLVAISHRVPAPALIVLTFVATKSLVSWRNRHFHEQSRRLRALPTQPPRTSSSTSRTSSGAPPWSV